MVVEPARVLVAAVVTVEVVDVETVVDSIVVLDTVVLLCIMVDNEEVDVVVEGTEVVDEIPFVIWLDIAFCACDSVPDSSNTETKNARASVTNL